jgi:hypothetical protein
MVSFADRSVVGDAGPFAGISQRSSSENVISNVIQLFLSNWDIYVPRHIAGLSSDF